MLGASGFRRLLFGHPLPTTRAERERLGWFLGIPVFAADAISSVAYATQEILLALVIAGSAALHMGLPVSVAIAALVVVVATSYMQVIRAYPEGGGAYTVAGQNLGRTAALVAAASLLIDYVLTVAVSVTAGIANLTSAIPLLRAHHVWLSLLAVALLTWLNLRGVRESAKAVLAPVFVFVGCGAGMILLGVWRVQSGTYAAPPHPTEPPVLGALTTLLILRAFASGCAALTGIEAVADGVTAFQEPRPRNARITLGILTGILAAFLLGITYLAHALGIVPHDPAEGGETVLSAVGRTVYGGGPFYYILQFSTFTILLLAANTSFAGFPQVASLLARDGYLPRQLANVGDRLVFGNGILVLGASAAVLVVVFGGSTHHLIPLYMIGVFLCFTLSQAGMFRKWLREKPKGWIVGCAINGPGALCTGVVLCVVTVAKFAQGAWITAFAIPVLVLVYRRIRLHYDRVAEQLSLEASPPPVHEQTHLVIVPVASLHRGTLEAIEYARSLGVPAQAVHVIANQAEWHALQEKWHKYEPDIPLVALPSPYRSLVEPIVQYVREQREKYGRVSVVIPEFVVSHWWEETLHNQSAIQLDLALRRIMHVSVVNFRYQLKT
ncbi:MAG: APC family permease [Armatimonadetes bacterium]|nr:APC family permease [Armatimonadota bacterium]